MKPVFQTNITEGEGNCFSACIASILELDMEDVPNFRQIEERTGKDMNILAREWLRDRGWGMVQIYNGSRLDESEDYRIICATPGLPVIACVPSPNHHGLFHAVVGAIDDNGVDVTFVHDPRPGGKPVAYMNSTFFERPRELTLLIPSVG